MKKTFVQVMAAILIVVFCVAGFSACASGSSTSKSDGYAPSTTAAATTAAGMTNQSYVSMDMEKGGESITFTPTDSDSGVSLYQPADNRKLIRSASISIQTERYEESVAAINAQIAACGGYIENSNTSGNSAYSGRYLNVTVRIPADRFDEFMAAKDSFGVVQYSNIWQDDVTFSYVDMEARVETLTTKKERLLALLDKATKMADIIELEAALSDTIYEIESYTSSLKKLDNQVSYSTVTINLNEVYKAEPIQETPKTLGERISQKFASTVKELSAFGEDLLVFLIGASPVLVILAGIAVAIIFISRASIRRSRRKQAEYLERRKAEQERIETKKSEDEEK
ncbi:MAG: DUF4349 domain-containing protein [Clostridiaceae bacterium]|nr:DUF4349 domain-containing protein [Clostridiaceae bacterium]